MNEITTARMVLTTAIVAAVAALFAGGASAVLMDVDGGTANGAVTASAPQATTIPYLTHGIGVDGSLFTGQAPQRLTGVHAALQDRRTTAAASTFQPGSIPYLSHGTGVDDSLFGAPQSLGLTGDSALTRASAPEPEGLTGDSALTRSSPDTVTLQVPSGRDEIDWTSFGAGTGAGALLAAAIGGIWLTTRRRGGVALP